MSEQLCDSTSGTSCDYPTLRHQPLALGCWPDAELEAVHHNGVWRFIRLDELSAKKTFRRYVNGLNRQVYGAAYRHHGKRLRVIPILEKSADGRWHYHVAIEPPSFMDDTSFGHVAMGLWLNTPLGYGHGDVSVNVDEGWIAYMAKRRGKSGLENYYDCIDTEALYNPLDC